jgi:hypothetical protein
MVIIWQLTSEKYPSGKVFNYSVDDFGRLQTVADSQRQYLNSVSFNNKGLLESMNLGNGTSESFGYNDRFQMTTGTQTLLSARTRERSKNVWLKSSFDVTKRRQIADAGLADRSVCVPFGNMYRKAANNGTAGQANPLSEMTEKSCQNTESLLVSLIL